MFKMGCSMARKILASDSSPRGSPSSAKSNKNANSPAGSGAKQTAGNSDELGDFSKLEADPRLPLNVRQIFKITKSWKAIARTMSKTGTAMFLNLFEQNKELFYLFDRFQHLKGEELHESMELREHAATVMSTLDQSINSLSDYDNFVTYLHSIGKLHRKVPGFERQHFWKIEQPFMKAIKQTLDERCNETIEEIYKIAIKLIIETIAEGYGEDDESVGGEQGNKRNNNNNQDKQQQNQQRDSGDPDAGARGNADTSLGSRGSATSGGRSGTHGTGGTQGNGKQCSGIFTTCTQTAAAPLKSGRDRQEVGGVQLESATLIALGHLLRQLAAPRELARDEATRDLCPSESTGRQVSAYGTTDPKVEQQSSSACQKSSGEMFKAADGGARMARMKPPEVTGCEAGLCWPGARSIELGGSYDSGLELSSPSSSAGSEESATGSRPPEAQRRTEYAGQNVGSSAGVARGGSVCGAHANAIEGAWQEPSRGPRLGGPGGRCRRLIARFLFRGAHNKNSPAQQARGVRLRGPSRQMLPPTHCSQLELTAASIGGATASGGSRSRLDGAAGLLEHSSELATSGSERKHSIAPGWLRFGRAKLKAAPRIKLVGRLGAAQQPARAQESIPTHSDGSRGELIAGRSNSNLLIEFAISSQPATEPASGPKRKWSLQEIHAKTGSVMAAPRRRSASSNDPSDAHAGFAPWATNNIRQATHATGWLTNEHPTPAESEAEAEAQRVAKRCFEPGKAHCGSIGGSIGGHHYVTRHQCEFQPESPRLMDSRSGVATFQGPATLTISSKPKFQLVPRAAVFKGPTGAHLDLAERAGSCSDAQLKLAGSEAKACGELQNKFNSLWGGNGYRGDQNECFQRACCQQAARSSNTSNTNNSSNNGDDASRQGLEGRPWFGAPLWAQIKRFSHRQHHFIPRGTPASQNEALDCQQPEVLLVPGRRLATSHPELERDGRSSRARGGPGKLVQKENSDTKWRPRTAGSRISVSSVSSGRRRVSISEPERRPRLENIEAPHDSSSGARGGLVMHQGQNPDDKREHEICRNSKSRHYSRASPNQDKWSLGSMLSSQPDDLLELIKMLMLAVASHSNERGRARRTKETDSGIKTRRGESVAMETRTPGTETEIATNDNGAKCKPLPKVL